MVAEMSGRPKAYLTRRLPQLGDSGQDLRLRRWAHNNKHVISTYTFDGLTSPGPCPLNCSNQFAVFSFHPKGANALFVDGSVHFLSQDIDEFVFFALVTRAGGEVIPGDAF